MTAQAQEVLNSFDRLPDTEQLEIGLEILRRLANSDFSALSNEDLALNSEELFLVFDQQESDDESS
jgi:hypothetical protein